jgi:uncharacterized phage protein (TIGR02218 family)
VSKTIPIQLLSHQALQTTTLCLLVKVDCVGAFAGTVIGFCSLDEDCYYNDGAGQVQYKSATGFIPKAIQLSAVEAVSNSQIPGVISSTGITAQMVRAGLFDSAKMTIYSANYEDVVSLHPRVLTSNRHEVEAYGRAGKTRYSRDTFAVDFRDLLDFLKQAIGGLYSINCRARFGSKPIGMGGEQPEERYFCGKDWVWSNGTVSGLGTEVDRQFSDDSLSADDDFYTVGVIQWLTGDNVGHESEIDLQTGDSGGVSFDLSFSLPYAIQVGDTYRVRQDCDKTLVMCRDTHDNLLNRRAEDLIPVDGSSMVPGAEINRA